MAVAALVQGSREARGFWSSQHPWQPQGVDTNSRAISRDERNTGLLVDCEESQAFAGMDRRHQCSPPTESRDFGGWCSLEAGECVMARTGPSLALAGPGAGVHMEPVHHMSKYLKVINQLNKLLSNIFWKYILKLKQYVMFLNVVLKLHLKCF